VSGAPLPWWAKIGAKIVLSRLPMSYRVWQRMGVFRHGQMDACGYALDVFRMHLGLAGLRDKLDGRLILELGPGDGVTTALICSALGGQSILVDTGAYAQADVQAILGLAGQLTALGLSCPDVSSCQNLDEALLVCQSEYLTDGLRSLKDLPNDSVDMIFSQSVLEHVSKQDFDETLSQCRRVLKDDGAFSNHIDLKDHLGGGLNNLRFSEATWESDLFSKSGFYTNRIRMTDMLRRFDAAGFSPSYLRPVRWSRLPIARSRLHPEFQVLTEEELAVSAFDIVLRRAESK
jgi:SAM-dependent methyltransferase